MAELTLILPWPPSVNGYWRSFRNRQIISKRGREYRKEICAQLAPFGCKFTDRLHVDLELSPPTLRKYDIDNFCKGVFDAVTHSGLWLDDELIDSMTIKKMPKVKGGAVKLIIKQLI